jgi:hypothetical protein
LHEMIHVHCCRHGYGTSGMWLHSVQKEGAITRVVLSLIWKMKLEVCTPVGRHNPDDDVLVSPVGQGQGALSALVWLEG